NLWGFVSQYTFRYRNYQFLSPAELYAMMSLESSEPSVKAILERSQSGDAVDVGANFGFYSVILSHSVRPDRKVVSIEPDPVYFGCLEKNVSLNRCVNVTLLQAACWSSEVTLSIVRPVLGVALDSHVEVNSREGSVIVRSKRLDSILAES